MTGIDWTTAGTFTAQRQPPRIYQPSYDIIDSVPANPRRSFSAFAKQELAKWLHTGVAYEVNREFCHCVMPLFVCDNGKSSEWFMMPVRSICTSSRIHSATPLCVISPTR
jgi:hypothetical protein